MMQMSTSLAWLLLVLTWFGVLDNLWRITKLVLVNKPRDIMIHIGKLIFLAAYLVVQILLVAFFLMALIR